MTGAGEIRIEAVNGGTRELPGALLHDWRGSVFVPRATAEQMRALLVDFDHFPNYYAPRVVSSRILQREGERATIEMRFREQMVRTVVLDARYRVETRLTDADRGYSVSRSAGIWQIDAPGTARERRRAEGEDDGFLWRLNSYWRFARAGGGLWIECEAVSLTRDVPVGLGWLIRPIIEKYPASALRFTMQATANALAARVSGEVSK